MGMSYNYMKAEELEKLIEEKRKELYMLDTMSRYPFGVSVKRDDLALSIKIMRLNRELLVLQEALIFRQKQLLKGKYFYAIKK